MHIQSRRVCRICPIAGAMLAAAILAGCAGLERGGQPVIATPSAGVFAPSAVPYGKTYGEWSVLWWQWVLGIPEHESPMTHADMAPVHDAGSVVFLTGTFGASAERSCAVPEGKAIFFPLVNTPYVCNLPSDTEKIARASVKQSMDHVTDLWAALDGVLLHGLQAFRFQSPAMFMVSFDSADPLAALDPLPPYPPLTYPCFCDGYWLMLEPLSPGEHTLAWGGKTINQGTYPYVDIVTQDITYHLTVE